MIPPTTAPTLRVMLYDDDAVPPNSGIFSTVHLPGLTTVLMMEGGGGVMGTVQASTVRSWGDDADHAALWSLAIANSVRAENAQLRSFAESGAPDFYAAMSPNRVAGTLLSVLNLPQLRGDRGCIVSYPHKDMFFAHRFDTPDRLNFALLFHMTQRIAAAPDDDTTPAPPQPMWFAHDAGFEPLAVSRTPTGLNVHTGPLLRQALNQ